MNRKNLIRRDFLIGAGAIVVVVLVAAGFALFRSSNGDFPAIGSPYGLESEDAFDNQVSSSANPILLLIGESSTNPFGAYLGEILRTEGLNLFQVAVLADLSRVMLDDYDTVLLSEGTLNTSQIEILEEYVFNGGNLIAMRPDQRLAGLFGVDPVSGATIEGYIRTEKSHPVTDGIVEESLQFHGPADHYRLAGAEAVAWISNSPNGQFNSPGLTTHNYGNGRAAMWAFDLARSVAYTRQGNPDLADHDVDGLDGVRTIDLFKNWIDLDRISIPQADEQQRLLTNLLVDMSEGARPLPRLWYFPAETNGMLIATGDSHMNPAPYIDEVLSLFDEKDGHMTIYYSPELASNFERAGRRALFLATDYLPVIGDLLADKFETPTPGMVDNWRSRGHEFTLHPWVEEGLEEGWRRYWNEFTGRGYGPVSPTVRTHRVRWSGWTETARVQSSYGIRMNTDYYHVGPSLQKDNGEWVYGHITGSGLPMKFVDSQGRILNIFQQNTQLADEHLISMDVPGWGGWPDLTPEQAIEVSKTLLNKSIENGGYAAIVFQFHADPFQIGGEAADKAKRWIKGTLDHAISLNLPIWSAQEWFDFVDLRHSARFEDVEWLPESRELKFNLVAQGDDRSRLEILIPLLHAGHRLSTVTVDETQTPFTERTIGSTTYAGVSVTSLPHEIVAKFQYIEIAHHDPVNDR